MFMLQWHSMRLVVITLALLGVTALPASGDVASDGPKVGQWKTWVLTSSTELQVPAPPAETSDQTKAELAELRQLQKERSPSANTAIQYYNITMRCRPRSAGTTSPIRSPGPRSRA